MPRVSLCRLKLFVAYSSLALVAMVAGGNAAQAEDMVSSAKVAAGVQPKIVKIYGSGGFQNMQYYQSGFLISADGFVLTNWSSVLDGDVTVTLDDGQKYEARLMGIDPLLEIAVLKIRPEEGVSFPHFKLEEAVPAECGTRVLGFNNMFNVAIGEEQASIVRGVVSSVTNLKARRGIFETPYRGTIYVIDAITNNPGAPGGAVTNGEGQLIGLIGKELRNSMNHAWLNYAIPISEISGSAKEIMAGKKTTRVAKDGEEEERAENPIQLAKFGVLLVPDILELTPPFIDIVTPGSLAEKAGLKADDLVIFANDRLAQSCKVLERELNTIENSEPLKLTVMRDLELIEVTLPAQADKK